jgi:hypothetical protein
VVGGLRDSEFPVAGTADDHAGVPMPRTHDAHAARLKMEFVGLVQARHRVPAEAEIKFAPLEFVGGIHDHTGAKVGAVEEGPL